MEAKLRVLLMPSAQLRAALQAHTKFSYYQVNGRQLTRAHYPRSLLKHGLRRSGGWRDVSSTKRLLILIMIYSVNRISICQSMVRVKSDLPMLLSANNLRLQRLEDSDLWNGP